ncbi:MAG: PAS domain S-box protein [Bacteroidales bacterium]
MTSEDKYQHQLIDKLIDNEPLLDELLNSSDRGIVFINTDGRIVEWNNAMTAITGYAKEHVNNEIFWHIVLLLLPRAQRTSSFSNFIKETLANHITRKETRLFDKTVKVTLQSLGGEVKIVRIQFITIQRKEEQMLGILVRDTTDEKRLEIKHRDTLKYLDLIFNNQAFAIAVANRDGNIVKANAKFTQMTGYAEEEAVYLTQKELTHPVDQRKEETLQEQAISRRLDHFNFTKRIIRRDGQIVWVKVTRQLEWNKWNQLDFQISFLEDITRRKIAEEAVVQSESKLRHVTENASDIIYTIRIDGIVDYINQSFERLFGYARDEIIGKSYKHFMHPDEQDLSDVIEDALRRKEAPSLVEHRFVTKDGNTIFLEFQITPLYNQRELSGVLGIGRDITHRKKEEIKQKAIKKQLEDLVQTQDRLFSIIAHDLKNPFNSLMGFSDLIINNFEALSQEDIKEIAREINYSAQVGFSLLQNLLEWSRTQSGELRNNPIKVHLQTAVQDILLIHKNSAEEKQIKFNLSIPEDLHAYVDEHMLQTVLRNLLSNAIKFSFTGGTVRILAEKYKDKINLKIIDSGIGIAKDVQQKLFNPAHHFTTRGTSDEKGTGLGLLISKELIGKWKGILKMESEPGKGTSITITLPNVPNPNKNE